LEPSAGLDTFFPKGYHPLLRKAMQSMILIATLFSSDHHTARLRCSVGERSLRLRIALDALSLPREQIHGFFAIDSLVRAVSSAESLGLAPVVAHQIITIQGGEMRLVNDEGDNGYLEVVLV
jgi:hypothetical protein